MLSYELAMLYKKARWKGLLPACLGMPRPRAALHAPMQHLSALCNTLLPRLGCPNSHLALQMCTNVPAGKGYGICTVFYACQCNVKLSLQL